MTTDRAFRASDEDREHVVEILRTHYTDGRLTIEEFDERMTAAYAAKTWGDLLDLTNDLPADVRLGRGLVAAQDDGPVAQPSSLGHLLRVVVPLVPLLLAAAVVASLALSGIGYAGHHHRFLPFFPIWLLVMVVVFLRRGAYRHRGGRGGR